MTVADTGNGPIWVVYFVTIVFVILSITLLSGHGSWLIAGYNTMSNEEKKRYNKKKLCRGTGIGMSFIAVLLLITSLFYNQLPASFTYVSVVLIFLDIAIMIILGNMAGKNN